MDSVFAPTTKKLWSVVENVVCEVAPPLPLSASAWPLRATLTTLSSLIADPDRPRPVVPFATSNLLSYRYWPASCAAVQSAPVEIQFVPLSGFAQASGLL